MIEFLTSSGWNRELATFVATLLGVVAVSTFGLLWVILGIWVERKVAGRIQDRLGPNRTGPYGLFQTFADIGKLLIKEDITPTGADKFIFNLAPLMALGAILLILAVIPFGNGIIGADLNIGVVFVAAVGGFHTLAILLAGWGSNNKYALLGAFRVVAQLISYEVPMIFTLLIPVILAGSMSMQTIVLAQAIPFVFVVPLTALAFFISTLAEAGRAPFDLLEAESEIIAGFNIEYSGMKFAMFYAAEFLHAFLISMLVAILFLGGWRGPGVEIGGVGGFMLGFIYLFIKTMGVYFVGMLIRNTVPRLRIDHMMSFNWKFLVPLSMINLILVAIVSRLFVPNYAEAEKLVSSNGLLSFFGSIFNGTYPAGFIAEFPRFVALLLINIGIIVAMQRVLRTYVTLDQRKTRSVPNSGPVPRTTVLTAPVSTSTDGATAAPAGR